MFRKVMQIDDDVIFRYFELLSARSNQEIATLRNEKAEGRDPREIKALFAERAHHTLPRRRERRLRRGRVQEGLLVPTRFPTTWTRSR